MVLAQKYLYNYILPKLHPQNKKSFKLRIKRTGGVFFFLLAITIKNSFTFP